MFSCLWQSWTVLSGAAVLLSPGLSASSLCLFVHWNEFGKGGVGHVILRVFMIGFCTLSSMWMLRCDWVSQRNVNHTSQLWTLIQQSEILQGQCRLVLAVLLWCHNMMWQIKSLHKDVLYLFLAIFKYETALIFILVLPKCYAASEEIHCVSLTYWNLKHGYRKYIWHATYMDLRYFIFSVPFGTLMFDSCLYKNVAQSAGLVCG